MHPPGRMWRRSIPLACAAIALICAVAATVAAARPAGRHSGRRDLTYAALADRSTRTLEQTFYTGHGLWRMCDPAICNVKNRDWGADALTNLLYFRWQAAHDRSVLPILRTLAGTARMWSAGEPASSDSVMWDAVAEVRMYQASRSRVALAKAEAAIAWIGTIKGLGSGACPAVDFQWPFGHRGPLKTIETASNYIKAALLLYQVTGKRTYLTSALAQYAQVRRYYLEPSGLYTAYLFDNGTSCHALPGQYFASVNGNMIWAGQRLATVTGNPVYLREAIQSARAVQTKLSDGAGVFADLQADNDIVGPLVEAMYALAHSAHERFAARWLLTNASAAGGDVNTLGEYGRFFDGPPPAVLTTAWQTDGGIALTQAAAALDPSGHPAKTQFWGRATFVPGIQTLGDGTPFHPDNLPLNPPSVHISFTGRAIAIVGDVGAMCCSAGHARVLIDGVPTASKVGIWQNMSSPARQQPDQVLFAWRWRHTGHHVITILPARYDPEEGGSFFAMTGYLLVH